MIQVNRVKPCLEVTNWLKNICKIDKNLGPVQASSTTIILHKYNNYTIQYYNRR